MRILFVAIPHSIHSARWIGQIADMGWEIHLIPSMPGPLHESLVGRVTFHDLYSPLSPMGIRRYLAMALERWSHHRGSGHARRLRERIWQNNSSIDAIIQSIEPDIVHSMEIQHAGYMTLEVKKRFGNRFPTWIVSNWGSDVYLYHRIAAHKARVREVLGSCDYYACECHRDVALARKLGVRGKVLPVLPCGGGFDMGKWKHLRQQGPTSQRRTILLKGYQHWSGRGLVGLKAIEMCADLLKDYCVIIQLASVDVPIAAELLAQATGICIELSPHNSYEEAMARFGAARIHIGLSISDGISQSLLESMVMGALPIQSGTACATEWIEDGVSGFIVDAEDPHQVAAALRQALTQDDFVDRAVAINDETVQKRLAYQHIQSQVISMYKSIYESSAHR